MTSFEYKVLTTSRFDRDFKALTKRNARIIDQINSVILALQKDPYNNSKRQNVKKLKGVKTGEGLWRIAFGEYRIRYDIFDRDILLYSCKLRREIYRG